LRREKRADAISRLIGIISWLRLEINKSIKLLRIKKSRKLKFIDKWVRIDAALRETWISGEFNSFLPRIKFS
jgi:hypothetical protein